MNREILFRGKRTDNGKWVNGLLYKFPCDDGTNIPSIVRVEDMKGDRVCVQYPIISETVGRYIGLTDRNGVKIFEGDIVKYEDTIHKVVFESKGKTVYFGLAHSGCETLPFGHCQDLLQIEVIGNIHDNPELLKNEETNNV